MSIPKRFPFIERRNSKGETNVFPCGPIALSYGDRTLEVFGLFRYGSEPKCYALCSWLRIRGCLGRSKALSIPLSGNLAPVEAKGLAVIAQIDDFPPVILAFAWAKSNDPPLILGQLNFFIEFDVCFYRSQLAFDIFPRRSRNV